VEQAGADANGTGMVIVQKIQVNPEQAKLNSYTNDGQGVTGVIEDG
jgi:hypothetical protein